MTEDFINHILNIERLKARIYISIYGILPREKHQQATFFVFFLCKNFVNKCSIPCFAFVLSLKLYPNKNMYSLQIYNGKCFYLYLLITINYVAFGY